MLASDDFLQQARRSDTDFTRQRALPLSALVPLLLNLRKGTVRDELDQFFETRTDEVIVRHTVSEAAFCHAWQKLKPEALTMLNDVLIDAAETQIARRCWRDFRVLAVDGSTARLPNTAAIAEYFQKPIYRIGEHTMADFTVLPAGRQACLKGPELAHCESSHEEARVNFSDILMWADIGGLPVPAFRRNLSLASPMGSSATTSLHRLTICRLAQSC